MIKFRQYILIKVVSIFVIISFLAFDIAWAYPSEPVSDFKLAAQLLTQYQPMTSEFGETIGLKYDEAKVAYTISDIADYLFVDPYNPEDFPLPFGQLAQNIRERQKKAWGREFSGVRASGAASLACYLDAIEKGDEVRIPKVMPEGGVVVVPYEVDGEQTALILIARKGEPSSGGFPGMEWEDFSEKYTVKVLVGGQTELKEAFSGKDIFNMSRTERLDISNNNTNSYRELEYCRRHVERVALIAGAIGKELGLLDKHMEILLAAAEVHDGVYIDPDAYNRIAEYNGGYKLDDEKRKKFINTNMFLEYISKKKGTTLTPEEESGARTFYDHGARAVHSIKSLGVKMPKEVELLIRYLQFPGNLSLDADKFRKDQLTISVSDFRLLLEILYAADIFENANNVDKMGLFRGGRSAETFDQTIGFIEKSFKQQNIDGYEVKLALRKLIGRMDEGFFMVIADARRDVHLGQKDLEFIHKCSLGPEVKVTSEVMILKKPLDFEARKPIRHKNKGLFKKVEDVMLRGSIERMWNKFELAMDRDVDGGGYDVIVFTTKRYMADINRKAIEDLRGVAYPEDQKILLVVEPDEIRGNFSGNVNAALSVREQLRQMGVDFRKVDLLLVHLSGKATRNEPLTHTAGLGGKHLMAGPSGYQYLARTLIQSYQFLGAGASEPCWIVMPNDQIMASTTDRIFEDLPVDQNLVIVGKRYGIKEYDLNNCAMKVDGDGYLSLAQEKPSIPEGSSKEEVLERFTDDNDKVAASLFVSRYTPQAIETMMDLFSVPAGNGVPMYVKCPLDTSYHVLTGSTVSEDEWMFLKSEIDENHEMTKADWLKLRDLTRRFRTRMGIGFRDLGDAAFYEDTGVNVSYLDLFRKSLTNPALQAFLGITPDRNGNVVIGSFLGSAAREEIKKRKGVFIINSCIEKASFKDGSVAINVGVGEVRFEGENCIISNILEDTEKPVVVKEGYITTDLFLTSAKRSGKIRIQYPLAANPKEQYVIKLFGEEEDMSFSEFRRFQDVNATLQFRENLKRTVRQRVIEDFVNKGKYPFNYEEAMLVDNFEFVKRTLQGEVLPPPEVEIHPVSICNLGCEFCIGKDKTVPVSWLSESQVEELIDSIHRYNRKKEHEGLKVKRIRFAGITGEPLFNPDKKKDGVSYNKATVNGMRKAIALGYEVGLVTNGTLLTEEVREVVVNGKYIHISLDAASGETFSKLKKRNKQLFDDVVNNIRELVKLKKTKGTDIEIGMGFVLTAKSYHEMREFIELAMDLRVDYVRFRLAEGLDAEKDKEICVTDEIREKILKELNHLIIEFNDNSFKIRFTDETDRGKVKPYDLTCPAHALLTVVGPQGNLSACCHVAHKQKAILGNVVDEGFGGAWEGDKKKKVIANVLIPRYLCSSCPPRAARVNHFLNVLINHYEREPEFLDWLESWRKAYVSERAEQDVKGKRTIEELAEDKDVPTDGFAISMRELSDAEFKVNKLKDEIALAVEGMSAEENYRTRMVDWQIKEDAAERNYYEALGTLLSWAKLENIDFDKKGVPILGEADRILQLDADQQDGYGTRVWEYGGYLLKLRGVGGQEEQFVELTGLSAYSPSVKMSADGFKHKESKGQFKKIVFNPVGMNVVISDIFGCTGKITEHMEMARRLFFGNGENIIEKLDYIFARIEVEYGLCDGPFRKAKLRAFIYVLADMYAGIRMEKQLTLEVIRALDARVIKLKAFTEELLRGDIQRGEMPFAVSNEDMTIIRKLCNDLGRMRQLDYFSIMRYAIENELDLNVQRVIGDEVMLDKTVEEDASNEYRITEKKEQMSGLELSQEQIEDFVEKLQRFAENTENKAFHRFRAYMILYALYLEEDAPSGDEKKRYIKTALTPIKSKARSFFNAAFAAQAAAVKVLLDDTMRKEMKDLLSRRITERIRAGDRKMSVEGYIEKMIAPETIDDYVQSVAKPLSDKAVTVRSALRIELNDGCGHDHVNLVLQTGARSTISTIRIKNDHTGGEYALPVEATVRVISKPVVRMKSLTVGYEGESETSVLEDIFDYDSDRRFALHKAALVASGIIPESFMENSGITLPAILEKFTGSSEKGIEITVNVKGVPAQSGLGTSSTISTTLLAALTKLSGQSISDEAVLSEEEIMKLLVPRTLYVEQLQGALGGWLDSCSMLPGTILFNAEIGQFIPNYEKVNPEGHKKIENVIKVVRGGLKRATVSGAAWQFTGLYALRTEPVVRARIRSKEIVEEQLVLLRDGRIFEMGPGEEEDTRLRVVAAPAAYNEYFKLLRKELIRRVGKRSIFFGACGSSFGSGNKIIVDPYAIVPDGQPSAGERVIEVFDKTFVEVAKEVQRRMENNAQYAKYDFSDIPPFVYDYQIAKKAVEIEIVDNHTYEQDRAHAPPVAGKTGMGLLSVNSFAASPVGVVAVGAAVLFFGMYLLNMLFRNLWQIPAELPEGMADYAVGIGCSIQKDGTASTHSKAVAEECVRLYKDGKVRKVVFSGGNSENGVTEAQAMRNYAVEIWPEGAEVFLTDEAPSDKFGTHKQMISIFEAIRCDVFPQSPRRANVKGLKVVGVAQYLHARRAMRQLKNSLSEKGIDVYQSPVEISSYEKKPTQIQFKFGEFGFLLWNVGIYFILEKVLGMVKTPAEESRDAGFQREEVDLDEVREAAKRVFEYLVMREETDNVLLEETDLLVVLGNSDETINRANAEAAVEIYKEVSNKEFLNIICSGGNGEAERLRDMLIDKGIDADKVNVEIESQSMGLNFELSIKKFPELFMKASIVTVVQIPLYLRQANATFRAKYKSEFNADYDGRYASYPSGAYDFANMRDRELRPCLVEMLNAVKTLGEYQGEVNNVNERKVFARIFGKYPGGAPDFMAIERVYLSDILDDVTMLDNHERYIEYIVEDFFKAYDGALWSEKLNELESIIDNIPDQKGLVKFLLALSNRVAVEDAVGREYISDSDYENILGKAFSAAFKKDRNSSGIRQELSILLKPGDKFDPIAVKTARSYFNILDLTEPLKVTTLFAMYKEQKRMGRIGESKFAMDFLRLKIAQLEDLKTVNANFEWELVMVNDGDNRDPEDANVGKSIDMAMDIVNSEYNQYTGEDNTGCIKFYDMSQGMREKINSKKGGVIMYGIWRRLRDVKLRPDICPRPDMFILTDADVTVPLSFEGLLTKEAMDSRVGMVIGSAQKDVADVKREDGYSQLLYKIYVWWVHLRLSHLRDIKDTMMGFKAARTGIFEKILPFSDSGNLEDSEPKLDPKFVPRMAFDKNMMSRIVVAGHDVREIPVTWVKSWGEAFRAQDRVEAFPDSFFRVPRDIKWWEKKLKVEVDNVFDGVDDKEIRKKLCEKLDNSADADSAATFLWVLMQNKENERFLPEALKIFLMVPGDGSSMDESRIKWLRFVLEKRKKELSYETWIEVDREIKGLSRKNYVEKVQSYREKLLLAGAAAVDAVITDFDGVDKDHREEFVLPETVQAKRKLSELGVRNITVTGAGLENILGKFKGAAKTGQVSADAGNNNYCVLTNAGARGHMVNDMGRLLQIKGFKGSEFNVEQMKRVGKIAQEGLREALRNKGLNESLAEGINIGITPYGIIIYAENDPENVLPIREHIAEVVSKKIGKLRLEGILPEKTNVRHSAASVDIMPRSKGDAVMEMIKLLKLTNVVLIADTVGTEEAPGNDRDMLALTPELLEKAGIDWGVKFIKIYVGREKEAEMPEGVIIAPQGKTESEPAREAYSTIAWAKEQNNGSTVSRSDRPVDELITDEEQGRKFFVLDENTPVGMLKDILEERYEEIERSEGPNGERAFTGEYYDETGAVRHVDKEELELPVMPELGIWEKLKVKVVTAGWRDSYKKKKNHMVYAVDEPHNSKKCQFCGLKDQEILCDVMIRGRCYSVAINFSPFGDKHMLLISNEPISQNISERVEDVVIFVRALGPGYQAFFNSPGGAASVMHFHVQIIKGSIPIMDNMEEKGKKGSVKKGDPVICGGGQIKRYHLSGWPVEVDELVGRDVSNMAAEIQKDIRNFMDNKVPYNSLLTVDEEGNLTAFNLGGSESPYELKVLDSTGASRLGGNDKTGSVVANNRKVLQEMKEHPDILARALYSSSKRGILSPAKDLMSMSDDAILSMMPSGNDELKKHAVADLKYVEAIAHEMGYTDDSEFMKKLRVICLAHDIGGILGIRHDENIENKLLNLANEYGIGYIGVEPLDVLVAFEEKDIILSVEEKMFIPNMDHGRNSVRILEGAGIVIDDDVKDIIEKHMLDLGDADVEGWSDEKKLLFTCFTVSDAFECGNNYYKRKGGYFKYIKGFEEPVDTVKFIRDIKFRDTRFVAPVVEAIERMVNNDGFKAAERYSHMRIMDARTGFAPQKPVVEFKRRNILEVSSGELLNLSHAQPEVKDHLDRVGRISLRIARVMGISEENINILRAAAFSHDSGKIDTESGLAYDNLRDMGIDPMEACNKSTFDEFLEYARGKKGIGLEVDEIAQLSKIFEHGIRCVEFLKERYFLSPEVELLIRNHGNYRRFVNDVQSGEYNISISLEILEVLLSILLVADMIENGNNALKGKVESYAESFKWIDNTFEKWGVKKRAPRDILAGLIAQRDPELLQLLRESRGDDPSADIMLMSTDEKLAIGEDDRPGEDRKFKDYIIGHVRRVARIAELIGRRAGISDKAMEILKTVAEVHDGSFVDPEACWTVEGYFEENGALDEAINEAKDPSRFIEIVAKKKGADLMASEKLAARDLFDHGARVVEDIKTLGISMPLEVELLIRGHSDLGIFEKELKDNKDLLFIPAEEMRFIRKIHLVSDLFENFNNVDKREIRGEKVQALDKSFGRMSGLFQSFGGIQKSDPSLVALIDLLVVEDVELLKVVLDARKQESLMEGDRAFLASLKRAKGKVLVERAVTVLKRLRKKRDREEEHVTKLFEIVAETINNTRGKIEKKGNDIIGCIKRRDASFDVPVIDSGVATVRMIKQLEGLLDASEKFKTDIVWTEIKDDLEFVRDNLDQLEADSIIGAVINKVRDIKDSGRTVTIALDLSWIPGYVDNKIVRDTVNPVVSKLALLENALKSMELDNVRVVIRNWNDSKEEHESVESWQEKITEGLSSEGDYSDVMVFGSMEAVKYYEDKWIKDKINPNKRAFLAGVDASGMVMEDLAPGDYWDIGIMEMFSAAFEAFCGKDVYALPIIDPGRSNKGLRKIIFLPRAKPQDIGEIMEKFKAKRRALVAV